MIKQNLELCLIKSVWSNFSKIEHILFNQINLMKYSQSKFKSPRVKKWLQNETADEWIRNWKLQVESTP